MVHINNEKEDTEFKIPFILLKDYKNKNFIIRVEDIDCVEKCEDGDSKIVLKSGNYFFIKESVSKFYQRLKDYYL